MNKVERRYARLIRLYPARAPREEILDTVLEGAHRFSYREALSLVAGALLAHTEANVHRTPGEFLHSAARLAALALLVYAAAVDAINALPLNIPAIVATPAGIVQHATASLAALVLHLAALVALAHGAYRLAAPGAVLGLIASFLGLGSEVHPYYEGLWAAPLAAVLIAALTFTTHRNRSAALGWLIVIPPAVVLLPTGVSSVLGIGWHIQQQAMLVIATLALVWSLLDARVPAAVAVLSLCNMLTNVSLTVLSGSIPPWAIALSVTYYAAPPIALVAAAIFSRRRSTL
jgi:hypothetical protein